jgi:proton-dependent oligopeptide transporter, POT family
MKSSMVNVSRFGSVYVLAAVVWEFFSYYGMQALLTLYMVDHLDFSTYKAYSIFGAYTTFIYLTPLLGGWVAEKYLGYKRSVLLGATCIVIGHLFLCFGNNSEFYYGLAWLVLGVGFFKSNAIFLVGAFFKESHAKNHAYAIYYVGGNIGATAAPIVCSIVATYFGWRYGFLCAGLGMLIGIVIMLCGWKQINAAEQGTRTQRLTPVRFMLPILGVSISLLLVLVVFLIKHGIIGLPLLAIGLVAFWILIDVFKKAEDKKPIWTLFLLIIFATIFWAFDQQGGSSISVFIDQNIQRKIDFTLGSLSFIATIPAAAFQAINPAVIIIGGPLIGLLWQFLGKRKIEILPFAKLGIGMLLITMGFYLITYASSLALAGHKGNMILVTLALASTGLAEMFLDPVVLAYISQKADSRYQSRLSGVYYLYVGAYANYLAMKIAQTTTVISSAPKKTEIFEFWQTYQILFFFGVALVGVIFLALILCYVKKGWLGCRIGLK